VLAKHNVELIGAKLDAIRMAEDRQLFKEAMQRIGLKTPQSGTACTCVSLMPSLLAFPC
jgi:carbamoyl-phosphate synthase large subunit